MKKLEAEKDISDSITSLSINGLHGRELRLPAPKNKSKEILIVYGHHASIERMEGFIRALNKYGSVTIADMPGFGGMDSFYKIGLKPTIDNLADYLAAYIKLRYRSKPITIVTVSLGFVIVTRMLQKYPSVASQVDLVVGGIGFLHHSDIVYSHKKKQFLRGLTRVLSFRLVAKILELLLKITPLLRFLLESSERKNKTDNPSEVQKRINFEIILWQTNDMRTHFYTLNQILHLDICSKKVPVRLESIATAKDQYLDRHIVNEHLKIVYPNHKSSIVNSQKHAPTVVASADEAINFIPLRVRRILNKN